MNTKVKIYRAMDSFLTEDGERSASQLNQDRKLFVEKMENIIEDEKNEIIGKVGILRQLVGESNQDIPDWIYEALDKIAPLMTEEQREEFNKNINDTFKLK